MIVVMLKDKTVVKVERADSFAFDTSADTLELLNSRNCIADSVIGHFRIDEVVGWWEE